MTTRIERAAVWVYWTWHPWDDRGRPLIFCSPACLETYCGPEAPYNPGGNLDSTSAEWLDAMLAEWGEYLCRKCTHCGKLINP